MLASAIFRFCYWRGSRYVNHLLTYLLTRSYSTFMSVITRATVCEFRVDRKIQELEEELKVVGNNMKALEISEQELTSCWQ